MAVLPSSARLAPPEDLRAAPAGPDPVLAAGQSAAMEWFGLVEVPIALGEALRAEVPDERTPVARSWRPFEVAMQIDGSGLGVSGTVRAWVGAEILQVDDGSFAWSIGLAPTAVDEPRPVADGVQDGLLGHQTWDLAVVAQVLGSSEVPGLLQLDVRDPDAEEGSERGADGTLKSGPLVRSWQLVDLDGLSFEADLAITDDDRAWPATLTVFHDAASGGIGAGIVQRGVDELSFTACWDAVGATLSRVGDPGVVGAEGPACSR